jgi:hypothetical protein
LRKNENRGADKHTFAFSQHCHSIWRNAYFDHNGYGMGAMDDSD